MKFCTICVTPSTRPDLEFSEDGICDACQMAMKKRGEGAKPIDWEARAKQFGELVDKYRSPDPSKYDCIVPVSGGKDSTYQVHIVKERYGLRPLCICFEPTLPIPLGRKNLDMLNRMGVDLIHVKRNPIVYEKLVLEAFKRVGDPEWPNHLGIWSTPYRYAAAFDIPLIIWGEGRMEFAGTEFIDERHLRELDEDWAHDYGCLNGLRAEDFIDGETGLTEFDMQMYAFPAKEKLAAIGGNKGCTGLFLGYFFNWRVRDQLNAIEPLGWNRMVGHIEGAYCDFENLDCYSNHLHDYIKYCKFGYGRATDQATRDIREGVIDREQGVRLAERYDGEYPRIAIAAFCERFNMTRAEFDEICDNFTNPAIFEMRDGKFCRDLDGGLVMSDHIREARRHP